MTEAGLLSVLIPERYGGRGLGLEAAAVILEAVNASAGSASACHAQMYTMGTLLRHGSDEQKERWLPAIATGDLRLQAFAVEVGRSRVPITGIFQIRLALVTVPTRQLIAAAPAT